MDSIALDSIFTTTTLMPLSSTSSHHRHHHRHRTTTSSVIFTHCRIKQCLRVTATSLNGSVYASACPGADSRSLGGGKDRQLRSLESSFRYDKSVPEEIIEKPIGLSLAEKVVGDNQRCTDCQAKGAVLCSTCTGSGLYIDSIMESQGIIVKVRCMGCGGSGNIMCAECGGRGHLGHQ